MSAQTTVIANCGGTPAEVIITDAECDNLDVKFDISGDTLTLIQIPGGTDKTDFIISITAEGTCGEETSTGILYYKLKKHFGTPATVAVHLGNDSVPVPTKSDGTYEKARIITTDLIASAGTTKVNITGVEYGGDDTSNIGVLYGANTGKVIVSVNVNATWSGDNLEVPLVCTLDGDYGTRTVTMNFYKVRAAEEADYPDVFDLVLKPTAIYLELDEDGKVKQYRPDVITPELIVNTSKGVSESKTVTEFLEQYDAVITYNFDGNDT